ncbi:hypothetical protein BCV69DRAFT_285092 [Microstroma glucosiphilum]|uniref:Uncharacterized protein n=1 Tax=Pseudomicrostroma glucosiphilum TaxID=1684307 RepID=A0A316U0P9_9BASI|nr:hypothetical protein BCV69DRAFT_285092 [Pseudomicrostroma glucosiphilum]PWN18464.1 hypothetical protein BCV69DRAFT_285092 [Pseudomicrostroma glucosiphilum]
MSQQIKSGAAAAAPPRTVKTEPGTTAPAARNPVKKQRSPSPPPPTTYRDIPLLSTSSQSPWLHHLIRFAHHNRTDPTDQAQFVPPLKLNRKHPPRIKAPAAKAGDPVVDRYGKPIRLSNGNVLKWPVAGEDLTEHRKQVEKLKPVEKTPSAQYDSSLVAPSAAASSRSYAHRGKGQKRVRQIHKASATARRIHNDETLPWVLEDYETGNYWESSRVGRKDSIFALAKHLEEGGVGVPDDSTVKTGDGEEDVKPVDSKVIQHAPWVGKLEGDDASLSSDASSSAQVLFVFDERNQGGFKVVPIRRTYRFMQKSRFMDNLGDEEREKEYARQQKSRELAPGKFVTRNTNGGLPGSYPLSRPGSGSSASGMGVGGVGLPGVFGAGRNSSDSGSGGSSGGVRIKKEEDLDDDSWPQLRGLSLGSGPSRPRGLVAVSGGASRGRRRGDDDDDEYSHRRGDDEGGTFDELDYQEDFADDEERMGGEAELVEDNEAREMEERLKREMAKAGFGGEDDEDDGMVGEGGGEIDAPQGNMWGEASSGGGRREDDQLTGSGKQMKKIMKALAKREGGMGEEYESDEEYNPYVSDDEEEEEEVAMANPEEAMRLAREEKEREEKEAARLGKGTAAGTSTATPSTGGGGTGMSSTAPSGKNSRGTTPVPSTLQQSKTNSPSKNKNKPLPRGNSSGHLHRAGSGHADVAKRATTNIPSGSGGSSSGGGARSRGGSPHGSRSPSPSRGFDGSSHLPRQSSPLAGADASNVAPSGSTSSATSGSLKRPASPTQSHTSSFQGPSANLSAPNAGSGSSNKDPSAKRLKTSPSPSRPSSPPHTSSSSPSSTSTSLPGIPPSPSSLEGELISLVRGGQVKSIAEVIARFKRRLQERPELKGEMMAAFKKVLTGGTKGEALRVKEGY